MQVFLYSVILLTTIIHWWIVSVPLLVWTSYRYAPGGVIVLGVLLDGYFGNFYTWPILTTAALGWYWLVLISRPRIVGNA